MSMFESFLRRVFDPGTGERVAGAPTSSNRASSFHLTWDVPAEPLAEVSVVCEVVDPPTVPMLYFWAMQVSFMKGRSRIGGAHFGLQHHPQYPNNGAVNWGGYRDGAGELEGSVSDLPSALNNINTRTYPWVPHRRYMHRVYRSPDRGWRGSITDLETGVETVVRDLWVDADSLASPMVWSEVFAHCDHPSASLRWSELRAITATGDEVTANAVSLNYQTYADGGCANTNTFTDGTGFVQQTNTERRNPKGSVLGL